MINAETLRTVWRGPRFPGHRLPPLLEGGLPVLGHGLSMRYSPVELIQRGIKEHGELFSMHLPGALAVVMSGPRAHETYFRLPDSVLNQKEVYQWMTPIFGEGIAYDATPELMKEQMAFLHSALRDNRMRGYTAGFTEEAERFFDRWGDSGEVDMYEVGNELTIYTSSRALLGKNFRDKLSVEFVHLYQMMEQGLSIVGFLWPYLPIPAHRRRDAARAKLGDMVKGILREGRDKTEQDSVLATLLEATYADGRKLTDDEIVGLLLTIMFAGHHTSGVTFAWTGFLLHQHPEWLPRLREEQSRVMGDRADVTLEDLKKMELLERCVKETLRLYPPIILMMRKVMETFEYGGYEIPAGSMAFTCPAAAHRMPEVFANPDRFDPDRFAPGREEDKKNPMGMIAFGGGRHRCLGVLFAQLQLRAIWSELLRKFDFELVEKEYVPDYARLLVGPRQPCRMRFRRKQPKRSYGVPRSEPQVSA